MYGLSVVAMAVIGPIQGELGREELLRALKSSHDAIRDLSLIYEGESQFIGAPALLRGRPAAMAESAYQGLLRFRSDGATLLDQYSKNKSGNSPLTRKVRALRGDQIETLSIADDRAFPKIVETEPGSADVLNDQQSPHSFLFLWYFQPQRDEKLSGFQWLGWDEIDGHRCAKVRFDLHEGLDGADKPTIVLWIDLKRGGNPLRVERFRGERLSHVTDHVVLEKFKAEDGADVWIPVRAQVVTYRWRGDHQGPLVRESFGVVASSVKINDGALDGDFTVKATYGNPRSAEMSALQARLDARHGPEAAARPRTDPKSVQNALDDALARAADQSKMLDASKPTTESRWEFAAPIVIGLGGCLLIGIAIYRRAKGG
jgi:hypothetical protein